jgi:hypothetical protein
MAVSASRKLSALFLFGVLLLGTVAVFAPAMLGSRKVRQFCEALPTGASLADVRSKAAALGYSLTPLVDGSVAVEHPMTLGRLECSLRFDAQGRLLSWTRPP